MRAIKKLNNNVAVCLDDNNQELIAIGKGIGFPKMPYEITDLSSVTNTFYQIDPAHFGFFSEISIEILEVSATIVDRAKLVLNKVLNPNLVISLADHIDFAIKRLNNFKSMKILFSYEVEQFYPVETDLGRWAVEYIGKELSSYLPDSEITSIAMHFVNAQEEATISASNNISQDAIINEVVGIIENFFNITMNKKNFSYNRFVSHIRYLLIRVEKGEQFIEEDGLFDMFKETLPKIYGCSQHITYKINQMTRKELTKNEQLYLMIHIQRILQK